MREFVVARMSLTFLGLVFCGGAVLVGGNVASLSRSGLDSLDGKLRLKHI